MPFTQTQFFQVFSDYHSAFGFTVFLFYFLAALTVYSLLKKFSWSAKFAIFFLGLLWIWMGVAYHWMFFSKINPIAKGFAVLYIIQGCLLIASAQKNLFALTVNSRLRTSAAILFIAYALIIYPLIGRATGHLYPATPLLGLPCPTTIFTFAVLLLLSGKIKHLFAVLAYPVIWSVIGTFAAISLGVYADYFLPVSAVITLVVLKKND